MARQPATRRKKSPTGRSLGDAPALRLVMQMMAIRGASGNEEEVLQFIRDQLRAAGVPTKSLSQDAAHTRSNPQGEVGNLVVRLPGSATGPRRLLVAHVDTVPVCVGARPKRRGNQIVAIDRHTGLGADNRAGAAILLTTALDVLRASLPHPPLTFLWTVQEEIGLCGARHARLGLLGKPRLAFNFDGGSPARLTIGATGGYRLTIDIRGIPSHAGAAPEKGVSAIAIASLAIADLVNNGWHGQIAQQGRTGTSNIGVIRGGSASNVVADQVVVRAEARSHDARFRGEIVTQLEKAFQRATRQVRNAAGKIGSLRIDGRLDYESFRLPADQPCVVTAAEAVAAEGLKPELVVANGGLDANWLTARGIPTVSLGCGQRNIHTVDEMLEIDEFHAARRIALRLATDGKSS